MKLEDFTAIDHHCFGYLKKMVNFTGDISVLEENISNEFLNAYPEGFVFFTDDFTLTANQDNAAYAFFNTKLETTFGDEVWAKLERNKYTAKQPWWGIYFLKKSNIVQEIVKNAFTIGNIVFRPFNYGFKFLNELADTAIPERWDYIQYKSKIKNPILKSYLENMFYRLDYENKIEYENGKIAFNTGLISKNYFREIFIVCDLDDNYSEQLPIYKNARICLDSTQKEGFSIRPETAVLFTNINEVVFEPGLEIDLNDAHIFEDNSDRAIGSISGLALEPSIIQALFEQAVEKAKLLSRRNYKLIVPQYWKKSKSIQFLMPIYLKNNFTEEPACALVLERKTQWYQGTTILTLDMAYQNARLIAKPDDFWLKP